MFIHPHWDELIVTSLSLLLYIFLDKSGRYNYSILNNC